MEGRDSLVEVIRYSWDQSANQCPQHMFSGRTTVFKRISAAR